MKFYIEHTREYIEVYEVEANSEKEAKEITKRNWNINAPNITDKKITEKFRSVNGMYENGTLKDRFKNFYQ